MTELSGRLFFCSWSGGKDACLALYRAVLEGGRPAALLTTLHEEGSSSRGHGFPLGLLQAQSESLGVRLHLKPTTWEGYRDEFLTLIRQVTTEGIDLGVFGDIELREHRDWLEEVSAEAGIEACFPLWDEDRAVLIDQFLEAGFKATITSVKDGVLGSELLGRELGPETLRVIETAGADICGEDGEYHTAVTDGPLFSTPLTLVTGGTRRCDGYIVLDIRSG